MAKKYKRRLNGFGTVYKLSGNRSRPYVASVTTGQDYDTGQLQRKILGYFDNDKEAYDALDAYRLYNKGVIDKKDLPESLKPKVPTFGEIFNILYETDFEEYADQSKDNFRYYFKIFSAIHNKTITSLRLEDIQPIFVKKRASKSTLVGMKNLCNKIFKYAIKYDFIEKNYIEYVTLKPRETGIIKVPFSIDEIDKLWELDSIIAESTLIMIFTGLRIGELLLIKTKKVNLKEMYMIGGIKTQSGKDRIIPIHEKIYPLVERLISESSGGYLIENKGNKFTTGNFRRKYFNPLMEELKMNHTPHECRHTFASLAKQFDVKTLARKRIMGHATGDLTDDVYTHLKPSDLVSEVNKIKI